MTGTLGNAYVRLLLLAALPAGAATACRQAAGVLFDVPPPRPEPAAASAATPATLGVAQDTTRPPVESAPTADSVLALLPRHADGGVDWLAAERLQVIRPRSGPRGAQRDYLPGFGYDVALQAENRMFDAVFPHSAHVSLLACGTCHPAVFRYRENDNSMKEINAGRSCGVCHRTVASPASACGRCHPAMGPGSRTPQLDSGLAMARVADTAPPAATAYPPSRFTHWTHRIRYRCSACHTALFALAAGADTVSMADLRAGAACGACHDGREAFGLRECGRCHVAPEEGDR